MSLEDTPAAIQALPRDRRGLPIFFTIFQPEDGTNPDFRVLDPTRVVRCLKERLCGVCGEALGYWIAFIGGSKSRESRIFHNPGMHRECAEYSIRVCPFLKGSKTGYGGAAPKVDTATLDVVAGGDRPAEMFLMMTKRFEAAVIRSGATRAPVAKAGRWYEVIPF